MQAFVIYLALLHTMDKVTISEYEGVRYLHLNSPWIQGAMRLTTPNDLELDYTQHMMMWQLFMDQPQRILQLGLGAGSLTKFCYVHYPDAHLDAVELLPDVIKACHKLFYLPPPNHRLGIHQQCALQYLKSAATHSVDIIQVDLYGGQADHPALESLDFYQECARVLGDEGIITVNILGNNHVHARNVNHLQQAFAAVAWLPESQDGNIIAIAFKSPPSVDFEYLYERATQLTVAYGLDAANWVDGLEKWMQGD